MVPVTFSSLFFVFPVLQRRMCNFLGASKTVSLSESRLQAERLMKEPCNQPIGWQLKVWPVLVT